MSNEARRAVVAALIHTAVRECEALARDADELTRHGAAELTAMLAAINPILRPARND